MAASERRDASLVPTNGLEREPTVRDVLVVLALALLLTAATRWPLRRLGPFDFDEIHYLHMVRDHWFPMHHTLFLAAARLCGTIVGEPYAGFVALAIGTSALAVTATWWWLRALVRPAAAAAAALALGAGPVFWAYGAMAASYPFIVFIGASLLGIAVRARRAPATWHAPAATALLAVGSAYRVDIGLLWAPLVLALLCRTRRAVAAGSVAMFCALNLLWLALMLYDVGGWTRYRVASVEFAHQSGYLNSVVNLGIVDGPVRYAVKLGWALAWTLGLGLLAVPRGAVRAWQSSEGTMLAGLIGLNVVPALAVHLLLHFGVPGYAFHYVPALVALMALGVGRATPGALYDRAPRRLAAIGATLAALFWFYPTNYDRPGLWGEFDRAFARHTRVALRDPMRPGQAPRAWRTANSGLARHAAPAP